VVNKGIHVLIISFMISKKMFRSASAAIFGTPGLVLNYSLMGNAHGFVNTFFCSQNLRVRPGHAKPSKQHQF
jgi:hypothetical protein